MIIFIVCSFNCSYLVFKTNMHCGFNLHLSDDW